MAKKCWCGSELEVCGENAAELREECPEHGEAHEAGSNMTESERLIRVFRDGDQWYALVGENIQEGLAGFGATIAEALRMLANEWEMYGFGLAPAER